MAVVHLHDIFGQELRREWFTEDWRVVGTDAHGYHGAYVAKYGVPNRVLHLRDVLIGYGQIQTVLARFRKNRGKRVGGEVLELVHVQIERPAVFDARNVGAAHSSQLDFNDQEGTEDAGVVLA